MSTDDNNIKSTDMLNSNNNDDNSYQSFESDDPDSSGFGQVSPTEEHVVTQYDNLVDTTNGLQQKELDFSNSEHQSTNTCEYNEIPIMDVQLIPTMLTIPTVIPPNHINQGGPHWT